MTAILSPVSPLDRFAVEERIRSLWVRGCTQIPRAIDIAREGVQLVQQNWDLLFYANTVALLLAIPGLLGPVGTTFLSNGLGLLAALNALRPLLDSPPPRSGRG